MNENRNTSGSRCAVYLHYAYDITHPNSLADQERICRDFAASMNWMIAEQAIFSDCGTSGVAPVTRVGLDALIEKSRQQPRPFEVVLVDSWATLSREARTVLDIAEILTNSGIGLLSIAERLDSRDPSFSIHFALYLAIGDQYVKELRKRVIRGMVTRVTHGYSAGGTCYGYQSLPFLFQGAADHVQQEGRKLRIVESEAAVVRTIYHLFANGVGPADIARQLNAGKIPGPGLAADGEPSAWNRSSVKRILRSERYRGVTVFNRTCSARHPLTGQLEKRRRPDHEVIRVDTPDLRVVGEGLAAEVDARLRRPEHGSPDRS